VGWRPLTNRGAFLLWERLVTYVTLTCAGCHILQFRPYIV